MLVPGNPVKLSKVAEGPETRVPWVGEHTDDVLRAELGLDDDGRSRKLRERARHLTRSPIVSVPCGLRI